MSSVCLILKYAPIISVQYTHKTSVYFVIFVNGHTPVLGV